MAKRGLKLKIEGQRPNDLCHCGSTKKYKKCHGKGTKGTGKFPRESASKQAKLDRKELLKLSISAFQLKMIAETMRKRNSGCEF